MTKHGGTFKLSGETRGLLKENKDFFEQLSALNGDEDPEKIPLNILGKDAEARTEAKIQANGDVEVSFVFPVDNNPDSQDGRIYLRDTFVFDASEQKLKSFTRSAEYNGKGQGNWQAWLDKYKAAFAAAPLKAEDERVQKFAKVVARSFGRSITDETGATHPEIREVLKNDPSYVTAINALILKQHEQNTQLPDLKLKIKDKLNFVTLVPREDSFEVVFNIAVDVDDDPANGRIWLKDRFLLDAKTMAFKELKRSWELASESGETPGLQATLEGLQKEEPPKPAEAEAFIKGMLPVLVTGSELDATQGLPKLAVPMKLPSDYRSPLAKRLASDHANLTAAPTGTIEVMEAMFAVSLSQLGARHDASLGWWDHKVLGKAAVDARREESLIQGLFAKAAEQLKAAPTRSALSVLSTLKLEGREAELRDGLLSDPRILQLDSIGSEADETLRAQEFLSFARGELLSHPEYGGAAIHLAQMLSKNETVKHGAEQLLAVAAGKGGIGPKMEFLLPRFASQIADWKMLVAMGAAPFAGVAAELGGLRALSAIGKVRTVSGLGRFGAGAFGLGFEAAAFTAVHKGLESAVHDPSKIWAHAPKEILGTALLFGAMRFGHAVSGRFTRSMADGHWGTLFGGKTASESLGYVASPTGRILADQFAVGSLSKWGRRLSSVANHGSGIAAMYVAGAFGRRWGIHPEDKRNLGEHWFDAALMYTQATLGFSLMNHATGGKFQSNLAELKLRTAKLGEGTEAAAPAEKFERKKPITLKPKTVINQFELKSDEQSWPVQVKNLQRLWIGRNMTSREGVEYGDREATLNLGDKFPDLSQFHAILMKDETGIFWYVADTGSIYGTWVNGKKLEAGEYALAKPNSLIELGDNFKFRLEADGTLLEPDPRMTTVVRVPVPKVQRPVDPPKPASSFPMEILYPESSLAAESNAEVAHLKSMRGQIIQMRSGKPIYTLTAGKSTPPVVRIYVDIKGRWVLQKLDPLANVEMARPGREGEKRWTLEKLSKDSDSQPGRGRQDWIFIRNGDQIHLGGQIFDFEVYPAPKRGPKPGAGASMLPRPRRAPAIEVPIDRAGEALDPDTPSDQLPTGVFRRKGEMFPAYPGTSAAEPPRPREEMPTIPAESELEEGDRPTLVTEQARVQRINEPTDSDSEATRPGIPFPIDMPDQFPQLLLDRIPDGEAPFVLVAGARGFRADLKHTRYLLGGNPDRGERNQVEVQLDGHRIDNNHAEIYLGRKVGAEDYQWFLAPHPQSESGVYVDGYRKLKSDERVPLTPGRLFSLGDQNGQRGGIQFTFDIPWMSKPNDAPTPKAATVFPKDFLAHLDADHHSMGLRSNFGTYLLRGDRETTRYILGTASEKPAAATTAFVKLPGEKIAPEHIEIFVDDQAQWYLRVLSDSYPTYFKGREVPVGSVHLLRKGDPIELGGNPQDGVGLAVLFDKPDYQVPAGYSNPGQAPEAGSGPHAAAATPSGPVHELSRDSIKTAVPPEARSRKPPPRRPAARPPVGLPPNPGVAPPSEASVTPGEPDAAAEMDVHSLKTGVYPVRADLAGLLARSALGDGESLPVGIAGLDRSEPAAEPLPPSPETGNRLSTKPTAPPSVPGKEPKPAEEADDPMADWGRDFDMEAAPASPARPAEEPANPPAAPEPEESFADITKAVLGAADQGAAAQGDGIETLNVGEPPRQVPASERPKPTTAADLPPQGDSIETLNVGELPRQVPVSERPKTVPVAEPTAINAGSAGLIELSALHPKLVSPAILTQIEPVLRSDRGEFKTAITELKIFPQLRGSPNKHLVGSTEDSGEMFGYFTRLNGWDVGFESGKAPQGPNLPKAMKDQLINLVGLYYLAGKLPNQYQMASDGVNLKFSSFKPEMESPNTLLSLAIQPGSEVDAWDAVFQHFLTLGVPVEVIAPLNTEGMQRPYVGVFYRAEDAAEVHTAVDALNTSHPQILDGGKIMPFSHPMTSSSGGVIPGAGVMEHASDATRANLLEARGYALAKAFVAANKHATQQNNGVVDKVYFLRSILQALDMEGFDLNLPGFKKGSATGSHRSILGGDQ